MDYKNIYFAWIGIAGLVFWSLEFWRIFKRPELQIPAGKAKRSFIPTAIKMLAFVIGIGGWLLISYSMTGPRKPLTFNKSKIEVTDIFFVVDVSRSMMAEDFSPNRIEAAKRKIREFIKLRPTDRIGIIIFSEKAFTLLPLTTDLKLIDQVVDDIQVGLLGAGTAIGDALGLAAARSAKSEANSKVIILLTDGVNNVGSISPLQAADEAKQFGIKVYTIAIGNDPDANLPGYRIIPGGSLDLETLQKISSATGGKSYHATSESTLRQVLNEIQKLEKTSIDSSSQIVYEELFYRFLAWGCFLLALAEILRRLILREVL